MSALLQIENLNISFETDSGIVSIIKNLSLQIAPGEAVGVVGESGCGKSTAFRALTGLLPKNARVTADKLQFENINLTDALASDPRSIRGRRIATVFQDATAALNPYLTIGLQLSESAREHFECSKSAAKKSAVEMLTNVAMPDPENCYNKYPHELSGGQRQRAAIAAALMARPSLLVADEPTTALDPTLQAQILTLLETLQKERGLAMILISHDLGVVARVAKRVAVLYAGTIVEEAPANVIFTDPKHPYTRALLASNAPLDGPPPRRLTAAPGAPPAPGHSFNRCPFAPRCERATDRCKNEIPPETILNNRRFVCFEPLGDRP